MYSKYNMEQVKKYIPKRDIDKIEEIVLDGDVITIYLECGYSFDGGCSSEQFFTLKSVREAFKGGLNLDKAHVLNVWSCITDGALTTDNPSNYERYVDGEYNTSSKEVKELLEQFGVMGRIEDNLKLACERKEAHDYASLRNAKDALAKNQASDLDEVLTEVINGLAFEKTSLVLDWKDLEQVISNLASLLKLRFNENEILNKLEAMEKTLCELGGGYYGSELSANDRLYCAIATNEVEAKEEASEVVSETVEPVEEASEVESEKVEEKEMKTVNYTTEEILNTLSKTYAYKCKSLENVQVWAGSDSFAIRTTEATTVNGIYIPFGSVVLFNSLVQVRQFFKKDNYMSAFYCRNQHLDDKPMNADFTNGKPFCPICGGFWIDGVNVDCNAKEKAIEAEIVAGDIDAFIDDFEEVYTDETALESVDALDGAIQSLCEVNEIGKDQLETMLKGGLKEKLIEKLFPSFEFSEEDRGYIHALYTIEQDEKQGLEPCQKDIEVINDALTRFSECASDFTDVKAYENGLYYDLWDDTTYKSIDEIKSVYGYALDFDCNPLGVVFSHVPLEVLEHCKGFEKAGYDVRLLLDDGYTMSGLNAPLIDLNMNVPPLEFTGKDKGFSMLSLFGGLGMDSLALNDLGVLPEVDYIEKEASAVDFYNALHGTQERPKDIKDFHPSKAYDVVVFGSPCQDVSIAGNQEGLKEGVRSSLAWEVPRILKEIDMQGLELPNVVIWENVKGILTKSNIEETRLFYRFFELMGYSVSYKKLCTLEYGIPQNRERIYTVFLHNKAPFDFGVMRKYPCLSLEHYKDHAPRLAHRIIQNSMLDKIGNSGAYNRSLTVLDGRNYSNTITTRQDRCPNSGIWKEGKGYRYMTEKECALLQGLSCEQVMKLPNLNTSGMNRKLYKALGNAFSKCVIQEIFRVLLAQGVIN